MTVPVSVSSSRLSSRSSVVLPAPDGPTSTVIPSRGISAQKFSMIGPSSPSTLTSRYSNRSPTVRHDTGRACCQDRPVRRAIAAVGLASGLVVAGIAATPTPAPAADTPVAAVQAMLDARVAAVVGGDRAGFLATVDP